jgi:hypothetical protein
MQFLLGLMFVASSFNVYGRDSTSCKVLMGLLKHKDAQRIFFFDEYKHLPIIFIDTKHKFENCSYLAINDKQVEIVHDSLYVQQKGISYIIIHSFKRRHKKYEIVIEQKATGAYGHIEFVKKGGEFVVSKFNIGYF